MCQHCLAAVRYPTERRSWLPAQQRIVGTLAPITGMVAELRLLLTPENTVTRYCRDQRSSGSGGRPVDELCSSRSFTRCICSKNESELVQETAQRLWIGKLGSPIRYWKLPDRVDPVESVSPQTNRGFVRPAQQAPRVACSVSSIIRSSAACNHGSDSSNRFRPAPNWRTRFAR